MYMYAPVLRNWSDTFNNDASYSHGWALPFVSAYFAYTILCGPKGQVLRARSAPDGVGLAGLVFGCALFLFAQKTTIIFLSQLSFLIVLAGAITALFGRAMIRDLAFPYGILYFGLPLPAILYLPLTFRLQLMSSALAEHALDLLRVPALREGNIISLPNVRLEVVEACSGLHSLFALLAVACIISYVFIPGKLGRVLLTLTALPVAIALNAARVTIVGVTCYLLGPDYAEGFAHFSVGMAVFGFGCLIILFLGSRFSAAAYQKPETVTAIPEQPAELSWKFSGRMLLPAFVLGITLLLNFFAARTDAAEPLQRPWASFPFQLGDWTGRELSISESQIRSLGTRDLMLREYRKSETELPVGLYVAYFPQQRTGTGMHSPLHCIPGAGWQIEQESTVRVAAGPFLKPLLVNQIIFRKEEQRELVLYWYMEQGEVEKDELRGALLTLWNGVLHGRSDGCLIRISRTINSTPEAAFEQATEFIRAAVPLAMADFLPDRPVERPPSPLVRDAEFH